MTEWCKQTLPYISKNIFLIITDFDEKHKIIL